MCVGHPVLAATGSGAFLKQDYCQQDQAVSQTCSWTSGGCIRRKPALIRHAPYPNIRDRNNSPSSGHSQQQHLKLIGSQEWQQQQLQQQPLMDISTLKQQPLDKLLDLAINLASSSLERTMQAFQTACTCWAIAPDSDAAGGALELAEAAMSRTITRMQIAQQLASAVVRREQHSAQQQQQQGYQQLVQLMQDLQQHHLCMLQLARPEDDEGEEEVCSSWRPSSL